MKNAVWVIFAYWIAEKHDFLVKIKFPLYKNSQNYLCEPSDHNFSKIEIFYGCFLVNFLKIFRTAFLPKPFGPIFLRFKRFTLMQTSVLRFLDFWEFNEIRGGQPSGLAYWEDMMSFESLKHRPHRGDRCESWSLSSRAPQIMYSFFDVSKNWPACPIWILFLFFLPAVFNDLILFDVSIFDRTFTFIWSWFQRMFKVTKVQRFTVTDFCQILLQSLLINFYIPPELPRKLNSSFFIEFKGI